MLLFYDILCKLYGKHKGKTKEHKTSNHTDTKHINTHTITHSRIQIKNNGSTKKLKNKLTKWEQKVLINNYLKHKWIKISKQRQRHRQLNEKQTRANDSLPIRDSLCVP